MVAGAGLSEPFAAFSQTRYFQLAVAEYRPSAYLSVMANGLMPLARLCVLFLMCGACSSDQDSDENASAGDPAAGGAGGSAQQAGGKAGATTAGGASHAGTAASGDAGASGGVSAAAGSAGKANAGASGSPPSAVNGHSVYALECRGDSKDCNLAAVPCFGVGSTTPNVAAGWACANRCNSNSDCSDAPSGAEAQASCVPFTSASHCVLVCKSENQSFACPDGMTCYVPSKSPIGYCLWQ